MAVGAGGCAKACRAAQFEGVLRGRYRIEQVFGSVKGAYGGVVGARSWAGARSWVWGMWVLWNMVGLAQVGDGDGFFFAAVKLKREFSNTLHPA